MVVWDVVSANVYVREQYYAENGVPRWGTGCEACHACVHWCPRNVIQIGKSKGRLQYHHPAVKRTMLYRVE